VVLGPEEKRGKLQAPIAAARIVKIIQ